MLELAGVTAIDCSVATVTLRETVPLTAPEVAEMVTLPVPVLVARPEELTDAILTSDDDQVTFVSCCVLPSSKIPVAVNCTSVPSAMDGFAGVTWMEIRFAGTTVKVLVSLKAPTLAVMVAVPAETVVARPVLSTVATDGAEELQVTALLRSCEEPSV